MAHALRVGPKSFRIVELYFLTLRRNQRATHSQVADAAHAAHGAQYPIHRMRLFSPEKEKPARGRLLKYVPC